MYFHFTLKKTLSMLVIVTLLLGSIYATYSLNRAKFGGSRISTGMLLTAEKYLYRIYYEAKYALNNNRSSDNLASAISSFDSASGNTNLSQNENASAIPVLVYHAISKKPDSKNISRDEFEAQMVALKEDGWQTITLDDFKDFIDGKKVLPQKSFLLTFDDGAKNSYYPVDPILAVNGFNAVNFIIASHSDEMGSFYYLSAGEINSMINTGRWEIASHSYDSHDFVQINEHGETGPELANLLWLPEKGRLETVAEFTARVNKDLALARSTLEERFSVPIYSLAYPFGEFGQRNVSSEITTIVRNEARKTYDMVFYQTWHGEGFSYNYPQNVKVDDFIIAKRIEPLYGTTPSELLEIMNRGLPKSLPFAGKFNVGQGWFANWGKVQIENSGDLLLKSLENETGNAVVLDGSGDWESYRFTAKVQSISGSGISLWVRFKDNDNNALCNFGDGFIHAEETIDGDSRVIKGTRSKKITIPDEEFTIQAEVSGRTITCTLVDTGESVSTPFLNEKLSAGGIGIKTWDPEPGTAEILVSSVVVEPI